MKSFESRLSKIEKADTLQPEYEIIKYIHPDESKCRYWKDENGNRIRISERECRRLEKLQAKKNFGDEKIKVTFDNC